MPQQSAEQLHVHGKAQQFFFILQGEAVFEIGEERIRVPAGSGIHITPGKQHRIINEGPGDIEFLLSSQPSTSGDRTNC
jgi:mannose-6-phosphate isomerase-like protein (cupin superfamily)